MLVHSTCFFEFCFGMGGSIETASHFFYHTETAIDLSETAVKLP